MEINVPQRNAKVVISAAGAPLASRWDAAYDLIEMLPTELVCPPENSLKDDLIRQACTNSLCGMAREIGKANDRPQILPTQVAT